MKNHFFSILAVVILLLVVVFNDNITDYLSSMLYQKEATSLKINSKYKKNYDFKYVKNISSFTPYSYNDLLDTIYTTLNNNWDNFTFYCPNEYVECINDVKTITQDNEILTDINNYVHPYNSFNNLQTTITSSGEINLQITYLYTEDQISEAQNKIETIEKEIYEKDMDIIDKLKAAHDYIILNSKYDMDRKNTGSEKYHSNIAYGPLIEGFAICSGYADAMAIFINNLEVKNFKISSDTHVWNAIFINNDWYHIDPTWDDQMDSSGNETLIHKFFIINTENLKKYAATDHDFKTSVYREFLNN